MSPVLKGPGYTSHPPHAGTFLRGLVPLQTSSSKVPTKSGHVTRLKRGAPLFPHVSSCDGGIPARSKGWSLQILLQMQPVRLALGR